MTISKLTTTLTVLSMLVLPAISSANTYQYISTNGSLLSMEADSSSEALATAPNLALHSGVILVGAGGKITQNQTHTTNTSATSFYQFIDVNGDVERVYAMNATIALATAQNIAPHSGVILVTEQTKI